jgi:ABC-2 type transport system permease protein
MGIRSVLSFSLALAFGLYVLNALRSIIGGNLLGLFTPYYHFDPGYILDKGELNLPLVLISVAVIIVSMIASYILYNRRNIRAL